MAKRAKSQSKATDTKAQLTNLLAKSPAEQVFLCHDGRVFADMQELGEGLAAMSNEIFTYHSNPEKNDFSNWLRDVIKDEKLANDLTTATTRLEAISFVTSRLAFLQGGLC
jgi:hypothetical protein